MAHVIKVFKKRSLLDKLTLAPREFSGFVKSATWEYGENHTPHCKLILCGSLSEAARYQTFDLAGQTIQDVEWYFRDELVFTIDKDSYP